MNESAPSRRVIEQRIRNRMYEYLECVVGFEHNHPQFGLNALLNQWEDYLPIDASNRWPAPIYSPEESTLLTEVDRTWNLLCDATPTTIVDESNALQSGEWSTFVTAAGKALKEMRKRGKLSEDTTQE